MRALIRHEAGVDVSEAPHAERVRELLANAPANKAWRRRSYLVLAAVDNASRSP